MSWGRRAQGAITMQCSASTKDVMTDTVGTTIQIEKQVQYLATWPTDVFCIKWAVDDGDNHAVNVPSLPRPHTLLLLVPGNPGLCYWYVPLMEQILQQLGPGYAAHGVSLAGHATAVARIEPNASSRNKASKNTSVCWSIDGQVLHKAAFVDHVLQRYNDGDGDETEVLPRRLIFISHSIGAHFTQQLLLLRPDMLERCSAVINLMPFICMDVPHGMLLDTLVRNPTATIAGGQLLQHALARLPRNVVDYLLRSSMADTSGRGLAVDLIRQPAFARNFFTLGSEEIRNMPKQLDLSAICVIGANAYRPIFMLFAGNDHWAPAHHVDAWRQVVGVHVEYNGRLQHAFVAHAEQVTWVANACVSLGR